MAEISARAKKMWKRMTEWYGVRFTETYGAEPPDDWRKAVDRNDNAAVIRGLAIIRKRYLEHPPTLPQFEQALNPVAAADHRPSPGDLLCKFAMQKVGLRLSAKQISRPWDYFGSADGAISGVIIPDDGDHEGFRFTLLDIQAPDLEVAK